MIHVDEQSEVRCKYCHERDLYWEEYDDAGRTRFRLVDGEGRVHDCPKKPSNAPAAEFEGF